MNVLRLRNSDRPKYIPIVVSHILLKISLIFSLLLKISEKKGDKVRLLGPKERENDKNLGEPKGGVPAPMIDVLHRACLLWEKGNRQKLAEFIEESGYKDNETIWSVAQNLSLVLPDGDKEKQLLQGFLASKSVAISDRFKPQKTLKLYMGGEE